MPGQSFLADRSEEPDHIEVTSEDVLQQINTLDTNKSAGLYGIHLRVVKDLGGEITELLAIVCKLLL